MPQDEPIMIEAEWLTKAFDSFVAVRDVSLRVKAGGVLALLGPNGAGKTTTVRMLSGILVPTSGQARIAGENQEHRLNLTMQKPLKQDQRHDHNQ